MIFRFVDIVVIVYHSLFKNKFAYLPK